MTKTILITGSTDGIGLLTARKLAADGHHVLLHGRSPAKLEAATESINGTVESYAEDLSDLSAVKSLASDILNKHETLDVLINNAGVLRASNPALESGFDIRFMVNTYAPYLLTELLLPIIPQDGRVVNLSSAAQAPVDKDAMLGQRRLDEMGAYAQSKLAITIWTREWAKALPQGPAMIAVNPGSLLASKMVKEGFGVAGKDMNIGADILIEAALGPRFADASGKYFDNDSGTFANPNPAALDDARSADVMATIKTIIDQQS
ncbi:SDR family NAD(P)-dependent oxidoreductase [Roseibium denhamense]|uniref:Short chain dehydrogenase n=1 Tax=Roseibium denhamense TaxID=76305 RepID=A0ABY1NXJ7_9HYPH|nr:SDR family NAD(P)-dependent oxidoreductase [Roseibium denhamense]MTI04048.1 SDR family NAD(P)-dependent oxidoreductase [Roseibium denhamense]SMP20784.1 short chain dehydrogenase [Roseibium denhamense]